MEAQTRNGRLRLVDVVVGGRRSRFFVNQDCDFARQAFDLAPSRALALEPTSANVTSLVNQKFRVTRALAFGRAAIDV